MAKKIGVEALVRILHQRARAHRAILAIAGAPGAGKSYLAQELAVLLNRATPESAVVLQEDGYHFDDIVLVPRGLRARKRAPETFDVAGLHHMLGRLTRNDELEIAVPVYNRDLEIARADARIIPRSVRHLVVEGNYLLLDLLPWSGLRGLFDTTVMLSVPEPVLRARLTERWQGYRLSSEQIADKLDGNDLLNGRFVAANSIDPEFVVEARGNYSAPRQSGLRSREHFLE